MVDGRRWNHRPRLNVVADGRLEGLPAMVTVEDFCVRGEHAGVQAWPTTWSMSFFGGPQVGQ